MTQTTLQAPEAEPVPLAAVDAIESEELLDVSVILPAYNEELAVAEDLEDVRAAMEATGKRYEIIVVDDGSTDATADIVAERAWVRLIRHPFNRGTGAARTTGVRAARGRVVAFTDADRTYPNDQLPAMLELIDAGADMVIGARRVEAGTLRWLRRPAKEFLRRLAQYMTGSPIPDLNSGLRVQRRSATMRFLHILPTSHSWVSTITIAFLANGYLVKWHPIDYFPRVGQSTFHPIRDTYNYLSLIVRTVMTFNPLKVFLPLALVTLLAAAGKYLIYDVLARYGDVIFAAGPVPAFVPPVPGSTLALLVTGLQIGVIGLLADLIVRRTRL